MANSQSGAVVTEPAGYSPPGNSEALVVSWIKRARESQFAHYEEARRLARSHFWLGITATVFSTGVATALASATSNILSFQFDIRLVGIALSALAAMLSGLQTFTQPQERAEKHRSAGAKYGSIRRDLEQIFAGYKERAQWSEHDITRARRDLDAIATDAPHVPISTFHKIHRILTDLPPP